MHLKLLTRDSIYYDISTNFDTLGIVKDGAVLDLDVVEKSFTPGAVLIGERRISSSNITITVQINESTDTEYRDILNDLIYYCTSTEYIEDTDNEIRTRVEFKDYKENPDSEVGTVMRGSTIEMSFVQLEPYWEGDEISDSFTSADTTFPITNPGYLPSPPIIEIETSSACNAFLMWITENQQGMEIQDLNFGVTSTLLNYKINNKTGKTLLGDNEINRNEKIRLNTGFFEFPVGTFNFNYVSSISTDVTITYRPRYFV